MSQVSSTVTNVIFADLRGYGRSSCPWKHRTIRLTTKRAMAMDMVAVMSALGVPNFFVAGHDRGGRVAYRLALDHPDRVRGVALLDVVATLDAWERADARFVRAFWPWCPGLPAGSRSPSA